MRRYLTLVLVLCAVLSAKAQDGIYADFTTSMGSFTCQLHYDRAPKTVANFIALATGERAWLDLNSGAARRIPFFDGLTFHRVVSGFVIQGGSRNGNGTDGPGYTFQDEFEPTLRHNKAGILSMANSGLNSNGSQFFITLAATSFLDDVHSVFGEVTSGLSVVQAIGVVAVDGNSKPITPVIMQSVTIRRVGAAAQAFNVSAQGLPSVGGAGPNITRSGASYFLQFPRSIYSEYQLFDSSNLTAWTRSKIGSTWCLHRRQTWTLRVLLSDPRIFTGWHKWPIRDRSLLRPALEAARFSCFSMAVESLILNPNNGGTGTGTFNGDPLMITLYTWSQEAYRAQFDCRTDELVRLVLSLVFTSANAGELSRDGRCRTLFHHVTGTFSFTPPAALQPIASQSIHHLEAREISKIDTKVESWHTPWAEFARFPVSTLRL
jgi:cyclophilin family peptidyl-prolyl cis-trans isomerase